MLLIKTITSQGFSMYKILYIPLLLLVLLPACTDSCNKGCHNHHHAEKTVKVEHVKKNVVRTSGPIAETQEQTKIDKEHYTAQ